MLAVEHRLASQEIKAAYPEIGDDVKVLGLRSGDTLKITVACAFVCRQVRDLTDYFEKKERVRALARTAAAEAAGGNIEVDVNTADGDTAESIYLTVTGLSADAGYDGAGRPRQPCQWSYHAVSADEPRGRCGQESGHAHGKALQPARRSHGARAGTRDIGRRRSVLLSASSTRRNWTSTIWGSLTGKPIRLPRVRSRSTHPPSHRWCVPRVLATLPPKRRTRSTPASA